MTSLRTSEGISLERISAQFGESVRERILSNAGGYMNTKKIEMDGMSIRLTREGKLLADGIAADLFFEPEDAGLINSDDRFPGAVHENSV
jgi:oxygen-independent coproporphyrinogen-3 oxidase